MEAQFAILIVMVKNGELENVQKRAARLVIRNYSCGTGSMTREV